MREKVPALLWSREGLAGERWVCRVREVSTLSIAAVTWGQAIWWYNAERS